MISPFLLLKDMNFSSSSSRQAGLMSDGAERARQGGRAAAAPTVVARGRGGGASPILRGAAWGAPRAKKSAGAGARAHARARAAPRLYHHHQQNSRGFFVFQARGVAASACSGLVRAKPTRGAALPSAAASSATTPHTHTHGAHTTQRRLQQQRQHFSDGSKSNRVGREGKRETRTHAHAHTRTHTTTAAKAVFFFLGFSAAAG